MPLLTPELRGTGGLVRVSEADFLVEELPLYEASGEGEHLYLTVEKIGRTTQEVVREIAQRLKLPEREVGKAGLKDKRAVTVQRVSVPAQAAAKYLRAEPLTPEAISTEESQSFQPERLRLEGSGWRTTGARLHGNKLRTGHLRGNRFRIVLRGCSPTALEDARAICARLRATSVANLFGPQRFGMRRDNAALGAAILQRDPAAARAGRDRFLRRLALSALQSELFNRCLAARIADGLFAQAIEGDVLRKRDSGGLFVCEDPAADSARVAANEVDPAGPLPGHSIFAARGAALLRERAVVDEAGIDPRSFAAGGGELEGARRPYRVVPEGLEAGVGNEPCSVVLSFSLPRGSYALAVLREVMKVGEDADETAA